MSDDALAPMLPPDELRAIADSFEIKQKPTVIDPRTGQPRRGRGRPPGAKNKSREPEGGTNPPARMTIPAGPRQTPSSPVDEAVTKKEEKKARAEQYASYINNELNERLFMLIIGTGAFPAEAIYKPGSVPAKAATNPNLTDFGNAIAIPSDVADSVGRLIAELTYTDAGKGIAKVGENQTIAIVVAALGAAFSCYRYSQQLKPILEQIRRVQEAQQKAREQQENNDGTN